MYDLGRTEVGPEGELAGREMPAMEFNNVRIRKKQGTHHRTLAVSG